MTGKFAISRAGHDKNQIYVIVGEEGEFVYLCDGRYRLLSKPKKKRKKHIQLMGPTVEEELLTKLLSHDKVMDEQIEYSIKTLKQ